MGKSPRKKSINILLYRNSLYPSTSHVLNPCSPDLKPDRNIDYNSCLNLNVDSPAQNFTLSNSERSVPKSSKMPHPCPTPPSPPQYMDENTTSLEDSPSTSHKDVSIVRNNSTDDSLSSFSSLNTSSRTQDLMEDLAPEHAIHGEIQQQNGEYLCANSIQQEQLFVSNHMQNTQVSFQNNTCNLNSTFDTFFSCDNSNKFDLSKTVFNCDSLVNSPPPLIRKFPP